MAPKDSAEIDTGFPIYGLRFVNNHTLLACGGGGEGKNGIPNKVTAIRCSFTVSDKSRRLQRFREITLPSNEDSPMCIDFCPGSSDENNKYSIFVGCNQSSELIRSMSINNNLRKYNYNDDEHLQFSDAAQFDDALSVDSIGEYPKIIHLSSDASMGAMMTSRVPSEIFIFNPDSLELKLRFKPNVSYEIKDFHLNANDSGNTLTYVTASLIETISTNSGNVLGSSSTSDKKTAKTLGKYFFSKVRYVDDSRVIITAALRNGKGAAVIEYNTVTKKVTRESVISKKIKGIVAIDISKSSGLVAVAGNDFSVSLLRLSDLKMIKTYKKLHKFAVTCLGFSPDGKKLATGSASNTLNVLVVKPSSGGFFSFIYSLFRFIFFAALIALFAAFVQRAHENGELTEYLELSKKYGSSALIHAHKFGKVGTELSQKYGKEYFDLSQQYGKIGYNLAKDQTFKGMKFLKKQIDKRTAPKDEGSVVPEIIEEYKSLPDWIEEHSEKTHTVQSDIVQQHTKDIHELTKDLGQKDTSSIIEEAVQYTMIASIPNIDDAVASQDSFSTDTPGILSAVENEPLANTETISESIDATPSAEVLEDLVLDDTSSTQEPQAETHSSSLINSVVEEAISTQSSKDTLVSESKVTDYPGYEELADDIESVPSVESVASQIKSELSVESVFTYSSSSAEVKETELPEFTSTSNDIDELTKAGQDEPEPEILEEAAPLLYSEVPPAANSFIEEISSSSVVSKENLRAEATDIASTEEAANAESLDDIKEVSSDVEQTVAHASNTLNTLNVAENSEYSEQSEKIIKIDSVYPGAPSQAASSIVIEEILLDSSSIDEQVTSSIVIEEDTTSSGSIDKQVTSSIVIEEDTTSSGSIDKQVTSSIVIEEDTTSSSSIFKQATSSVVIEDIEASSPKEGGTKESSSSGERFEPEVSEPSQASSLSVSNAEIEKAHPIIQEHVTEKFESSVDIAEPAVSDVNNQEPNAPNSEIPEHDASSQSLAAHPSDINSLEPAEVLVKPNVDTTVESQATPSEKAEDSHDEL